MTLTLTEWAKCFHIMYVCVCVLALLCIIFAYVYFVFCFGFNGRWGLRDFLRVLLIDCFTNKIGDPMMVVCYLAVVLRNKLGQES